MSIRNSGEIVLDDFDQSLIKVIGDEHPETLEEAVRLVSLRFPEGKEAIMERVLRLENEGKISFEKPLSTVASSLTEYFFLVGHVGFGVFSV